MFARISRLLAVVAIALTGFAALPASAQADPLTGVTCALGSYAAQFSPPVTTIPQNIVVQVSYRFSGCISAAEPELTGGRVDYVIARPDFTCLKFLDTFEVDYTIQWNDGETSAVSVNGLTVAETSLITGTVTAGVFQGESVTVAVQGLSVTPMTCFTPAGLTSYSGIMALDIG